MDNNLFQSPSFDPIAYLNQRFPDESSLSGLDSEIDALNKELQDVNADLIRQIHQHAMMNVHVSEEIQKARQLSKEVIKEIGIIKQKTTKSEEIVYEMCKDLKSLDIAKRNLTFSIDALKKFIMMVDALQKLREVCEKRVYKEVANLISAFNELSNYFKKYENIPQIQDLYKEKNAIIGELVSQITEDFEAFDKKASLLKTEDMHYACEVIRVLGEKYRQRFVQSICQIILQPYQQLYSHPDNSVLENTERRYGWIKRKMQDFNNTFNGIFPEEWGVNCFVLYEFCSITRLHLTNILERTSHNVNVAILMKSLEVTLKFEDRTTHDMEDRYRNIISSPEQMDYKITSLPKFIGSISLSFQPYLKPYIRSEEQAMYEVLDKNLNEDTLTQIKVYNSSVVLFHSIKSVLARVKQYSKGSLIVDILRVIKKILLYYRDKCMDKIKKAANYQQTVCYTINTGEHCKNIISGLEEKVDSMLDPMYREQINFEAEEQAFSELISKSIDNFISYMDSKLEAIFEGIAKVHWEKRQEDIMESDYVRRAKALIAAHFSSIKDQMNSSDLTYYMNKIVLLLNNKFMSNVFKCKKLPQNAYQFLKMDLGELKEELVKLVKDEKQTFGNPKVLQSYRSFISKTFSKSENFITLSQLPLNNIAERFDTFIEGGSLADLDRVLQIKGFKRADVPNLVKILEKRQS